MTFLDAATLADLTGYRQRAKQVAWLSAHGWPHQVSATGRVLVLREYFVARMSGQDQQRPTLHATAAHRFEAVV